MKRLTLLLITMLMLMSTPSYPIDIHYDRTTNVMDYGGMFRFNIDKYNEGSNNDITLVKVFPEHAMIPVPTGFNYDLYFWNVVAIADFAYIGCCDLEKVAITEGVKSIGKAVFKGCTALQKVTFPKSLTDIAANVFEGAEKISALRVNWDTPLALSSNPFQGQEKEITLYVPKGTSALYSSASVWKEFKEIVEMGSDDNSPNIEFKDKGVEAICVANWDLNGDNKLSEAEAAEVTSLNRLFNLHNEITSFDELRYFTGLTNLGDREFNGCSNLESIIIPENVRRLEWDCLRLCDKLQSVNIPRHVNYIDAYAFDNSDGIKSFEIDENNSTYIFTDNCLIDKVNKVLMWGRWATTIPDGIVEIGENAFEHNRSTSLTIPTGVKKIGRSAFWGASLTSVTIPEGVEIIDNHAFDWCYDLASVTLPSTLTTIGYQTFENCTALKSIIIPGNVKSLGGYAFCACKNLESVTLESGIEEIGADAFVSTSLKSIQIPASVTKIDGHLFRECPLLESVVVDSDNKFYDSRKDCNAIIETATKTLISGCSKSFIPDDVTTIGYNAFLECAGLRELTIPASVQKIESDIFGYSSGEYHPTFDLTDLTVNGMVPIDFSGNERTDFSGTTLHVPAGTAILYKAMPVWNKFKSYEEFGSITDGSIIETTSDGMTMYLQIISEVKKTCRIINLKSFSEKHASTPFTTAKSIKIPQILEGYTVTEIGKRLFAENTNITDVELPASITKINEYAFYTCQGLRTLTVNAITPPALEEGVFWGIPSIDDISLTVPNEAKAAYQAAEGWKNFKMDSGSGGNESKHYDGYEFSITDEKGIKQYYTVISEEKKTCMVGRKSVGNNAQHGIEVPWNVQTELTVPDHVDGYEVVEIAPFAFGGNYGLTKVHLPNTITTISSNAFSICLGLTAIEIPASVTSIGSQLHGQSQVTSIKVDPDNTVYDSRDNCNAIIEKGTNKLIVGCVTTKIPYGVKTIGKSAFYWFDGLTSITIPSSVETIEEDAFSGMDLTSLELPESVKSIGTYAFSNCKKLARLKLPKKLKKIPMWFIRGCESLKSLSIPSSVEEIEDEAFQECYLISLEIPEGVERIGDRAFSLSKVLETVTFPSTITGIGSGIFSGCTSLKMIKVADGNQFYESIGNTAIVEHPNAELIAFINEGSMLRIPDGIKMINGAILTRGYDNITHVVIPKSVKKIQDYFLMSLENLQEIRVLSEEPANIMLTNINDDKYSEEEKQMMSFERWREDMKTIVDDNNTKLYVPKGSKRDYENDYLWAVFYNNVEEIKSDVPGDFSGTGTVDTEDVVTFVDDFIAAAKSGQTLDNAKYDLTKDGKVDKDDLMAIIYLACGYIYDDTTKTWIWKANGSRMAFADMMALLQSRFDGTDAQNMLTDIREIMASGKAVKIYNLEGRQSENLRKGLNIVRDSVGRVRKVFVK